MAWWKNDRSVSFLDNDPKYTCCGCCHVRTGTICLGAYNLLLQFICMCVLVMAILHPELVTGKDDDNTNFKPERYRLDEQQPILPDSGIIDRAAVENTGPVFSGRRDVVLFTRNRIQSGDAHLALALLLGLEMMTALLIYGVCKSRPTFLLPFFCFQVFDFILACLTALGHYAWLPNIHQALINTPDLPFRDQLTSVNSQWVALCILLVYVLVLMVKSYFIGVVWAAYQYLQAKNAIGYRFDEFESGMGGHIDPTQMLLPPDYETASKMPSSHPDPPPQYHEA